MSQEIYRPKKGGGHASPSPSRERAVDLSQLEAKRSLYSERVPEINLHGKSEISPSEATRAGYERAARRLEFVPLDQLPQHFEDRREQVARKTWWYDHAVARKTLHAAREDAVAQGLNPQAQRLRALDFELQRLRWKDRDQFSSPQSPLQTRMGCKESVYDELRTAARERGDLELHDALVICRETGARPCELSRGIHLQAADDDTVAVYLDTAKKSDGNPDAAQAAQRSKKGVDRIQVTNSKDLAEVANRNDGKFQVEDHRRLQGRLRTLRQKVDGAEGVSFYSFRHNFKSEQAHAGASREEIARQMGHASNATQNEYGTY